MQHFRRPIAYLERSDFADNGDLIAARGKPVFVMIQGSYCGACTNAKPTFQQLADEGAITCMTVQVDGERQSEKDINVILDNIYPNLTGIPGFILYVDSSTRVPYTGGRSVEEMKQFVQQVIDKKTR